MISFKSSLHGKISKESMLYFFRLSEHINDIFGLYLFWASSNIASFKFSCTNALNKWGSYTLTSFAMLFLLTKNKLCRFKITWWPKYANSTGCSIVYNVVSQPCIYSGYLSPNTHPSRRGSFQDEMQVFQFFFYRVVLYCWQGFRYNLYETRGKCMVFHCMSQVWSGAMPCSKQK